MDERKKEFGKGIVLILLAVGLIGVSYWAAKGETRYGCIDEGCGEIRENYPVAAIVFFIGAIGLAIAGVSNLFGSESRERQDKRSVADRYLE